MADRKSRRRPRRFGLIDIANAVLGLVVLALLAVGAVLFWGGQQFYGPGPIKTDTTFIVERNSGLGTTAARLEDQGLIAGGGPMPARYIFQLGGYALKKQGQLKAGEFKIPAGASMADILTELTEGKPIQHTVTVPEGYTAKQVVNRLNAEQLLTGEVAEIPAEGSILPQTYNFDRGATRASVLARMQTDMADTVAEVWKGCDPEVCGPDQPIKTPEDLVTLASVVEKETGIASERPQVAAVFINRLKRGMRLQSDPTIIYGITKGEGPLGRDLKKSEIEAVNDYNTYQMEGLPKGPIANPGVDALNAVAHPAKTADLYFVAAGADPAQGHLFASTYKQHQANVAKYRAALRQAARDLEAEEAKEALEAEQAAAAGEDVTPDTVTTTTTTAQ
jgi:UPF0755 protein